MGLGVIAPCLAMGRRACPGFPVGLASNALGAGQARAVRPGLVVGAPDVPEIDSNPACDGDHDGKVCSCK